MIKAAFFVLLPQNGTAMIHWDIVAKNLRQDMKDYLQTMGLKALVVGESGGIDSALCSVLFYPVCQELGIEMIGRSIAIESNTPSERERGKNIGLNFCTNFREVDLTEMYHAVLPFLEEDLEGDAGSKTVRLRRGNIKARMRMMYLFNLAQRHRGMVLSTDNHTEWQLGFWTLHGDVGDYVPLTSLWKTEVYELAQYLCGELEDNQARAALQACIEATPTDGLGISSSDVEQLGATDYHEVDGALRTFLATGEITHHSVITRHKASEFKRANPIMVSRETAFKGAISRD